MRTLKTNLNANTLGSCQLDSILGVLASLVRCRMMTPTQLSVLVEGEGLEGAKNNVVCKHTKHLMLGQGPWVFWPSG